MEVGSHAVGCGTRPIASTCSTILPVQYVRLLKSILNGDVEGFYNCGSMRRDILEAPPVTLSLVGGSPLICVQRGRWQDRVITTPAAGPTTSVARACRAAVGVPRVQVDALPSGGYVPLTEDPLEDWVRTARAKVYRGG